MTLEITPIILNTVLALVRIGVILGAVLGCVPFMVLWERKLIAYIQQRPGPNRVGPWGILQAIVDGIKLFLKEDTKPLTIDWKLHTLAPILTVVPAIFVLSVVPVGPVMELAVQGWTFTLGAVTVNFTDHVYQIPLGITNLDISLLFYLAVSSVGVFGIVLAGYSSNSKYSLIGGIRSSAQMISYELAMGLSLAGVLLLAGTFDLRVFIDQQAGGVWNWYIWKQPIGFILFLWAGFAETNRLPFDLPEGESELGAGFHTEYSSMKFAMFFMAEYMNMFTFGGILITLFLGGWQAPLPQLMIFEPGTLPYMIVGGVWFAIKYFFFLSFMIFIRGSWPRFRYDQLMDIGWKVMFPMALVNMFLTALVMVFEPAPVTATVVLLGSGLVQLFVYDWILTARRKRVLSHVA